MIKMLMMIGTDGIEIELKEKLFIAIERLKIG
jgi:hypothetical protein